MLVFVIVATNLHHLVTETPVASDLAVDVAAKRESQEEQKQEGERRRRERPASLKSST